MKNCALLEHIYFLTRRVFFIYDGHVDLECMTEGGENR